MDRHRNKGIPIHGTDAFSHFPDHGFAVEIQIFSPIIVLNPGHGTAGRVIVINKAQSIIKAAFMSGAVTAVFDGLIQHFLSALFADRTPYPGQLCHAARTYEISFGQDNIAAHRAAAGKQDICQEITAFLNYLERHLKWCLNWRLSPYLHHLLNSFLTHNASSDSQPMESGCAYISPILLLSPEYRFCSTQFAAMV